MSRRFARKAFSSEPIWSLPRRQRHPEAHALACLEGWPLALCSHPSRRAEKDGAHLRMTLVPFSERTLIMASIHKDIPIDAEPAQVWAAVRDFGAVHRRLAPGFVLDA